MAGASGTATLDFGAFPGAPLATVDVTGQTGITTSALVECWIFPAGTTDHTLGEHVIDPPRVSASSIVAGTGFTIYGVDANGGNTNIYGKWNVAWVWDIGSSGTLPATRELLTADRTYYVRTDGSNSNNGLTNTAGGAFATYVYAMSVVSGNIDTGGHNITISIQNAAWTTQFTITAWLGGGTLTIDFNGSTLTVTGSDCILTSDNLPSIFLLYNVTLSTVTSGSCINHVGSGIIQLGTGITFGACAGHHMFSGTPNSQIWAFGGSAYTINGDATFHQWANAGGSILLTGMTVTISGARTFSTFARADSTGVMQSYSQTFSVAVSVTGQRYNVQSNGVLFTNGGGASYFPGTIAGSTSTGGQYL